MNYEVLLKRGLTFQQLHNHHFKENDFRENGFGVSLSKRGDFGIPAHSVGGFVVRFSVWFWNVWCGFAYRVQPYTTLRSYRVTEVSPLRGFKTVGFSLTPKSLSDCPLNF